jgi:hypothetical protein|tara:strand:+ start:2270 stop:2647 length:378 start_codon:yes stop_codon:yes gene_type:complete
MIYIPNVIQNIIYSYKQDLEYEDNKKNHKKKFKKTLYLIKKFENTNNGYSYDWSSNSGYSIPIEDETEPLASTFPRPPSTRTITIGPMNKNNHTYCFCFSICLNCYNYIHSSRMYNYNIAKTCQC